VPRGASYAVIVSGAGDQTQPSIDAQRVVYASSAAGSWDVLLYEIGTPALFRTVAATAADEDQPDVSGTLVAWRTPAGVWVRDVSLGRDVRTPDATPAGSRCSRAVAFAGPKVTDVLAAWECDLPGGAAVAVARLAPVREEYDVVRPGAPASGGSQRSPAAHRGLVAFIDGTDGDAVWLHDSTPGRRGTARLCDGRATGVSVGELNAVTYVAVTRAAAGPDDDVEIWDASGLVTARRVAGVQRNPHLSGDWVAFEDLSSGRSQIVLWNWVSGLAFSPWPTGTNQTLNDLSVVEGSEVRAVFADDGSGDLDVVLYRFPLPVDDDGTHAWPPAPVPTTVGARCDDADPTVLATLVLGVDHGERPAGRVRFGVTPPRGDDSLPVLVCVDLHRVAAAWLALDHEELLAASWHGRGDRDRDDRDDRDEGDDRDDRRHGRLRTDCVAPDPELLDTHVEVRTRLDGGRSTLAGVIAGKRGARLVARVLADPAPSAPAADPVGAGTAGPRGRAGCDVAGGGGPLGAVLVLLAFALRRRR
jgi:hypothetical protein